MLALFSLSFDTPSYIVKVRGQALELFLLVQLSLAEMGQEEFSNLYYFVNSL